GGGRLGGGAVVGSARVARAALDDGERADARGAAGIDPGGRRLAASRQRQRGGRALAAGRGGWTAVRAAPGWARSRCLRPRDGGGGAVPADSGAATVSRTA